MKRDEAPRIATARELELPVLTRLELNAVIGAAYDLDGLILTEADVAPDIFDLRTGLAGEVFQSFTNHGIRLALVVPDAAVHGDRFAELAYEHRHHHMIRFVPSEAEGRAWLESEP